jgi:catechol 2,3-dioxygenase-like lactoylglutathione lyase family enzyme
MRCQFHHVHLICSDLKRTADFFCQDLGAEFVMWRQFGGTDGATLRLGGTTVNLRVGRAEEGPLQDSSRPRFGYDHIGVEVEDLDAAYEGLRAKGYVFTVLPKISGALKVAFFKGPDDILVEAVQRIPEA